MNSDQIGAFVMRHRIPPEMAERRSGQPGAERLAEMVDLTIPRRPAPPDTGKLWGYTFLGSGLPKEE